MGFTLDFWLAQMGLQYDIYGKIIALYTVNNVFSETYGFNLYKIPIPRDAEVTTLSMCVLKLKH